MHLDLLAPPGGGTVSRLASIASAVPEIRLAVLWPLALVAAERVPTWRDAEAIIEAEDTTVVVASAGVERASVEVPLAGGRRWYAEVVIL